MEGRPPVSKMKFDIIINQIRGDLRQAIDAKTASTYSRFFKEEVVGYGVKTAAVTKIAGTHYHEIKPLNKDEFFQLCEELLKSDYMEEAFIVFDWAYRRAAEYTPDDFEVFEGWLQQYVNNWAKCDTFCNHTIGSLVERYPEMLKKLKLWAKSDKRWLRRASAVTLIIPAKKGLFLKDIFDIADLLLLDKDDLVQKGYGWMLKEASVLHRDEIFSYVMRNKAVMPRTALRYAIEKMPEDLRQLAMQKQLLRKLV
jgi:3-methyladenine DNA glycosylase AlkD